MSRSKTPKKTKPKRKPKDRRQEFLDKGVGFIKRYGRMPTVTDTHSKKLDVPIAALYVNFGTWSKYCEALQEKTGTMPTYRRIGDKHAVARMVAHWIKQNKQIPAVKDFTKAQGLVGFQTIQILFNDMRGLKEYVTRHFFDVFAFEIKQAEARKKENTKAALEATHAFYKQHGRDPKLVELGGEFPLSRNNIRTLFGSMRAMCDAARAEKPGLYRQIAETELYQKTYENKIDAETAGKTFVITTAVTGCRVQDSFYTSIKKFCELNDATLVILMAEDPAHNWDIQGGYVDSLLATEIVITSDTRLNDNFFISGQKVSAKMIKPLTGMDRVGKRGGSLVFASPKQCLEPVATGNEKHPHLLLTTGALTEPNYRTLLHASQRTAYLAEHDHVIGALVVEVQDDKIYHAKHIQALKDGSFYYHNLRYSAKGTATAKVEALVLGDWHIGSTCPDVRRVTLEEMVPELKPKRLVLHDLFDGASVSHHTDGKILDVAQAQSENPLANSLQEELDAYVAEVLHLSKHCQELVIVCSNHDEWLFRYLNEGRFLQTKRDMGLCLDLLQFARHGLNPLEQYARKALGKTVDKVRWLRRDEDYQLYGVQLGAHGDKGANGSKGSPATLEKAYGNCVVGHRHAPGMYRGVTYVGTSTPTKQRYMVGPSAHLNTHCVVYEGGSRALVNIIDSHWKLVR